MGSPPLCPGCGAAAVPTTAFAPLPLMRCCDCRLIFAPGLSSGEVRERYAGDDYAHDRPEYREDSPVFERIAGERVAWVERYARGGALLEVGCAQGLFLQRAKERGFEVTGVEATPLHVAHARELGVDVREGFLEDLKLGSGSFDIACLFHVLEHVVAPVDLLREVRRVLAPGGVLFVEVPNADSAMARDKGVRWPFLDPANHPLHFSPLSLRRALEAAGFQLQAMDTISPRLYLPRGRRLRPRPLLGYGYRSLRLGTLRSTHRSGHDLLRAVARRPPG
jgi:SAM-dependent methyltransferase